MNIMYFNDLVTVCMYNGSTFLVVVCGAYPALFQAHCELNAEGVAASSDQRLAPRRRYVLI